MRWQATDHYYRECAILQLQIFGIWKSSPATPKTGVWLKPVLAVGNWSRPIISQSARKREKKRKRRGSHCWLWGDRGDLAALLSQGRCPTRISLWWRRKGRRSPRKKMAQEPVGATSPWTPSWIISSSRIVHMFVTKKHRNKYISCTSPLSIHYLKSCRVVPNLFLPWDEN